MNKTSVILVTLILGAFGCSESQGDGVSTSDPPSMGSTLDGSALWNKVRLGPWECAVPEENPDTALVCTKAQRVVVFASDDAEGFRVSIPLNKKNQGAFLALTDKDNDGIYDSLNYEGTSKEGTSIQVVTDDNLDGNIDRIFNFEKKKNSVRIDGKWIALESAGRDDQGLVIYTGTINGSEKRVIFSSYPYQAINLPIQVNSATHQK